MVCVCVCVCGVCVWCVCGYMYMYMEKLVLVSSLCQYGVRERSGDTSRNLLKVLTHMIYHMSAYWTIHIPTIDTRPFFTSYCPWKDCEPPLRETVRWAPERDCEVGWIVVCYV